MRLSLGGLKVRWRRLGGRAVLAIVAGGGGNILHDITDQGTTLIGIDEDEAKG